MTLWPRTKRSSVFQDKDTVAKTSLTFFGDVVESGFAEFLDSSVKDDALEKDRREQAFILASIAARKMKWMKAAIAALCVALLLFAVALGAGSYQFFSHVR